MDKDVVHIHNGIFLRPKKMDLLPFVKTWMDLQGIMLSEVNQAEENKCHMISFLCGIEINKTKN